MSYLSCPLGRTPGINNEHPLLAKTSVGRVVSWVAEAGNLINLPTAKPGQLQNSAHFSGTMVRPIIGNALIQNSNSAGLTFNGSGANGVTLDRQTFAIICIFDTLGAQSYYLGKTQNGSGGGLAMSLNANGTRTLNLFAHGGTFSTNATATFNTGSFKIETGIPLLLVGSGINLASTTGNFVVVNLQTGQYLTKTTNSTSGTVNSMGDANPLATNATNAAGNGVIGALAAGFQIPEYFGMPELLAWATNDPWSFWYPGGPIIVKAAATANKTLVAGAGSYTFTGTDAGVLVNRIVAAGAGSYAITGAAANLLHKWSVVAGVGSYAFTGVSAGLLHGWKVTATAGSYAFTGTAANLLHKWAVPAGAGSYVFTGTDAGLIKPGNKLLVADPGSYAFTGTAASLLHKWVLTAAVGSYSFTGAATTNLKHSWNVAATTVGSYSFTGQNQTLRRNVPLVAGVGSYTFNGQAALLKVLRTIVANSGIYLFSGTDASLQHGLFNFVPDVRIVYSKRRGDREVSSLVTGSTVESD